MRTCSHNVLSIDVEDWFHVLDSPAAPKIEQWNGLDSHIEANLEKILIVLEENNVKATLFWLGWAAERHKGLVRRCHTAGHEICSHGYGHVLPYVVGETAFRDDICKAKSILEDIIGEPVRGFRAAGFGITEKAPWAFDVIKEAGYEYDSSIFPATRGHGGIKDSPMGPYFIKTTNGPLLEIPLSVIKVLGHRASFFGGGYLRLASKSTIRWGIGRLHSSGHPLIVYIHPREIDPDHPRLALGMWRRFKCYVNLNSTMPKLRWLCQTYSFCTMLELVEAFVRSFYSDGSQPVPIVELKSDGPYGKSTFRPVPQTAYCRTLFHEGSKVARMRSASGAKHAPPDEKLLWSTAKSHRIRNKPNGRLSK